MVYLCKVQKAEFTVIPFPLVEKLQELDLWNENVINTILGRDGESIRDARFLKLIFNCQLSLTGSVQSIEAIPADVRAIFKTAWEIDPAVLIQMAAARAPFICQSQSMSLFFKSLSLSDIVSRIRLTRCPNRDLKGGFFF